MIKNAKYTYFQGETRLYFSNISIYLIDFIYSLKQSDKIDQASIQTEMENGGCLQKFIQRISYVIKHRKAVLRKI